MKITIDLSKMRPTPQSPKKALAEFKQMREQLKDVNLKGLDLKELTEEGRK